MSLSLSEVMHIAAEAGIDLRTAKRALGGRRPSPPVKNLLIRALIERGHTKLAAALERDGLMLVSQHEPSWDRGPGRPDGANDSKPRKPYTKRKGQPKWK